MNTSLKSEIKKLGYDEKTAAFLAKKISDRKSDEFIGRMFSSATDAATKKQYCESVLDVQ
jgi:hypothetical protein